MTESLGVGGTESHLIRQLPELAKRGWTVAAFCLTERGAHAGSLEACWRRKRNSMTQTHEVLHIVMPARFQNGEKPPRLDCA